MSRPNASISPLKHESVADKVFKILRENILTQVFSPGTRLHLHDLAAKLGVSITPVNDAVNRLAFEGLVEIRARGGTFVSSISIQAVAETFELRAALECLAAEKMIQRLTPDLVEHFRELTQALEKLVTSARERTWHEQKNTELHQLIIHSAGSGKLKEMYQTLNTHITIARIHCGGQNWPRRLADEVDEHRAILQAIEQRDSSALVRLLRQHIDRAKANLLADLENADRLVQGARR
jgi:DNA-binding GntR family transcriptional regulator